MVAPAEFLKVTLPKVTPEKLLVCKLALTSKVEVAFHVAVGNEPVA